MCRSAQHGDDDQAPVALAETPGRVGEPRRSNGAGQALGLHGECAATSLQTKPCPPPFSSASCCSKRAAAALPWLARRRASRSASASAAFLSQVALTESRTLQAAIVAALLRACAVFLVAAQVAAERAARDQRQGPGADALAAARALDAVPRPARRLRRLRRCCWRSCSRCRCFSGRRRRRSRCGAFARARSCAGRRGRAVLRHDAGAACCPRSRATAGLYLLARSMASIQAIATGAARDAVARGSARALRGGCRRASSCRASTA